MKRFVSPVMLTVAEGTGLTLNVCKLESGFNYEISGRLLSGGEEVPLKQIKVYVNDTLRTSLLTLLDGSFSRTLNLQPADNDLTTYNIRVVFEGDEASNATVYDYAPNGTQYAVCTTIEYGYKQAVNYAVVTVEPAATQIVAGSNMTATENSAEIGPPKTPEQMQQEAEQNGSLRIWHEFSWWFPWYRIHFVSVYEGVDQYDQGISPLPFVGATLACSDMFLNVIKDLWSLVIWPVGVVVAGAEFTALLVSNAGPTGFIAALLVSVGLKGLSLIANWNSIGGLAGALIGSVFSTVMGMLKWTWSLVADFLKLLMGIIDLAEFGFGNLYRIFSFAASIVYMGTIMGRLHELGAIP